jgi:dienelactone hydrolase
MQQPERNSVSATLAAAAVLASLALTGCSSTSTQWTPPPCDQAGETGSAAAPCGRFGVAESTGVVRDTVRERDIRLKIYSPSPASPSAPVVIFSHGLGNSHEGYRYLGRHWASHGFVSVHIGHSGTDRATLLRRGRVYLLSAFFRRSHRRNRIDDIVEVAGRLSGGSLPLGGIAATPSAIGIAGHSLGALSVLAADESVPSARAVVAISPPVIGFWRRRETAPDVAKPTLFIDGGQEMSLVDILLDGSDEVFILELPDAEHETFSDDERRPRSGRESDIAAVQRVTTAFWKAYLGGGDADRIALAACVRDPARCGRSEGGSILGGGLGNQ